MSCAGEGEGLHLPSVSEALNRPCRTPRSTWPPRSRALDACDPIGGSSLTIAYVECNPGRRNIVALGIASAFLPTLVHAAGSALGPGSLLRSRFGPQARPIAGAITRS